MSLIPRTMLNPNNLQRFAGVLVLGNLVIVAILLLTMVVALQSSHRADGARAQQAAENLAHTLSLETSAEIRLVDNALLSATQQLARLQAMNKLNAATVARIWDELKAQVPQVGVLRFTDTEGIVFKGEAPMAASVAQRSYFQQARDNPDQLVISEPILGRTTKKWGIVLARARVSAARRFEGVVLANLSTDHFLNMFDDFNLGPQGAVTLRSDTLQLIARFSAADKTPYAGIGTSNVSSELKAALAANPQRGFFVSRTALDGIERVSAYERVPGFPLLVLVGVGTDEFFAPWRIQALEIASLTALLALMVVGLSVLFYKRQAIQLQTQAEISRLAAEREVMLQSGLVGMAKFKGRTVQWCNQALCDLFGYGSGELLGKLARTLYLDDGSYERVGQGYEHIKRGGQYRTQLQMVRKGGSALWIDLSGAPLPNGESLWMMVDVSAVKASETRAQNLAQHDALTGLANRMHLTQALGFALRDAERNSRKLAVCYLDLDGFKAINDRHGHDAGDRLLREVARRMTASARGNDLVARMGGDEFVILLIDQNEARQLEAALLRLLECLCQPVSLGNGEEATVSASVGVALFPDHGVTADSLIKLADQAMYDAKHGGKNRFHIYHRKAVNLTMV